MRAWALVWVLLGASGCVASGSIGKDLADGGEGGSSGSDATGDTGTDTGTETGTGTGASPCDPVDGDAPCATCQKANCCESWEACHADDRCVCITVCVLEGHSLDACLTTCGMDDGQHVDALACTQAHCAGHCP